MEASSVAHQRRTEAPAQETRRQQHGQSRASRGSLVMLPSTLDPKGRTIRRIATHVIDDEEQLLLVKRRVRAANATLAHCDRINQDAVAFEDTTLQSFAYLKVLGVGSTGRVLLVRRHGANQLYAMKMVSKRLVHKHHLIEKVLSERDVLGGTHHRGLAHLYCAFQSSEALCFVMEYCPGGELARHLQAAGRFEEGVAMFFAAELVLALEHLHRHGIVYRDLKPENILLTADGHVKLVDFGLSKFGITEAISGARTICGSYEYVAPEIYDGRGYGTAVDWWSFGCVLYEMLTGLPPWYNQSLKAMRQDVLTQPLSIPNYMSDAASSLLLGLLTLGPKDRFGSHEDSLELRQHPFFSSVDWQMLTFGELSSPLLPCPSPTSIVNADNFDAAFTCLSIEDLDNTSESVADFEGFDYVATTDAHIEYGYTRDVAQR